ncbi:HNH endonuclease [Pontibacter sp. Tf4]|uniref:HNH endonuclease signature motif containing protein n=1 Tax=Pontibacter sp. Tf4 TaxID=2761620 RepID=UPI001629EC5A|nr:HNH endonuclease signature motif containing protein [Pontibacter sp. Tf4]MBB6611105.1 HNH endonuclease [Pontibacter sp. Tf4]
MNLEEYKDYCKVDGHDKLFADKYGFHKISLDELNELYRNETFIPYAQYLRTCNWKSKRLEILDRDSFRCQGCGGYETENKQIVDVFGMKSSSKHLLWKDTKVIHWTDLSGNKRSSTLNIPEGKPDKPYNLQVHHKRYVQNRLPWEYDNEDLIVLCNYCHKQEHDNTEILVFDELGNNIKDYGKCGKCGGTGYIPEYNQVQGGVCFPCHGAGVNILLINKKL